MDFQKVEEQYVERHPASAGGVPEAVTAIGLLVVAAAAIAIPVLLAVGFLLRG